MAPFETMTQKPQRSRAVTALPASLIAHIEAVFPDDVDVWAKALGDRLPLLVHRWGLELGDALTGGWNSSVLACTFRGQPAVLKITLDPGEAAREAKALTHWGSDAAVEVLCCDPELGGLLIARLEPGTPLDDSVQAPTAIARLHAAPAPASGFPTLADHYADAQDRLRRMATQAPTLFSDEQVLSAATDLVKLSSMPDPERHVLLHGDAVPANFLLSDGGYRAIDPRAKIGDACFDVAYWALFANDGFDIFETATAVAGALALPIDRVLRWSRAIAVDRSLQVAGSLTHAGLLERLMAHATRCT